MDVPKEKKGMAKAEFLAFIHSQADSEEMSSASPPDDTK